MKRKNNLYKNILQEQNALAMYKVIKQNCKKLQKKYTISTNSRLYTILLKLKIEGRLLNRESRVEDCLHKDIDHADVNERIKDLQKESWLFLKKVLGSE